MLVVILVHLWNFLLHGRIPVVFNGVVGPAFQSLSDISPFVSYSSMMEVENPFFFWTPLNLLDHRIQMIVPSFSALFADPTWEVLCDLSPLLRTVSLY